MVFRLKPVMVGEEGTRRRNNIILIVVVLGVLVCGYYLFTLSRENTILSDKYRYTSVSLKKYGAAFMKCDRTLQTSKADVVNFQEATTQLQAKVAKQERDLAEVEKSSADYELKLEQAYQFFLDVKELLRKDDQNMSEDRQVPNEAATALKSDIQKLQSDQADYEKLKLSHDETTTALGRLKEAHDDLITRSNQLEDHAKEMFENGKVLKRELAGKTHIIDEKSMVVDALQNTVNHLQRELTRLRTLPVPTNPPLIVKTTVAKTEDAKTLVKSEIIGKTVGNAERNAVIPQEEVKSMEKTVDERIKPVTFATPVQERRIVEAPRFLETNVPTRGSVAPAETVSTTNAAQPDVIIGDNATDEELDKLEQEADENEDDDGVEGDFHEQVEDATK